MKMKFTNSVVRTSAFVSLASLGQQLSHCRKHTAYFTPLVHNFGSSFGSSLCSGPRRFRGLFKSVHFFFKIFGRTPKMLHSHTHTINNNNYYYKRTTCNLFKAVNIHD